MRAEEGRQARQAISKVISLGGREDSKSGMGGRGDRNWEACGEDEAASMIEEIGAEVARASDEGAAGSKGFAQRAYEHVGVDTELGAKTAASGPEGAEGMGFIDNESGIVSRGDGRKRIQGRDITIHAEQGFCDQKPPSFGGAKAGQVPVGCESVKVRVDGQFCAR